MPYIHPTIDCTVYCVFAWAQTKKQQSHGAARQFGLYILERTRVVHTVSDVCEILYTEHIPIAYIAVFLLQ